MTGLAKITVIGALLFILNSTAYAQSDYQPSDNNVVGNQQNSPGSSNPSSSNTTDQGAPNSAAAQSKNTLKTLTPDNIQWSDAPSPLPPGAQFAVLDGGLKERGTVVVRIKLPANYQVLPIYFRSVERLTVLSGTLNLGIGDKLDRRTGTALPAGSFVVIPAGKHHYFWAAEDTVVQIGGVGPWAPIYVNPKDDISKDASSKSQQANPSPALDLSSINSQQNDNGLSSRSSSSNKFNQPGNS